MSSESVVQLLPPRAAGCCLETVALPAGVYTNTRTCLPPEVMSVVFWWTFGPFADNPVSHEGRRTSCMLVHRSWKKLVSEDPTLWRGVFVDNFTDFSVVTNSLQLAGDLTVHLFVDLIDTRSLRARGGSAPTLHEFIDRLVRFLDIVIARTVRFTLRSHDLQSSVLLLRRLPGLPTTHLRSMVLDLFPDIDLGHIDPPLPVLFGRNMPALRSLSLRYSLIHRGGAAVFANLTDFHLSSLSVETQFTWDQVRRVLELMVCVTHLHLIRAECLDTLWGRESLKNRRCLLPSVTHLNVAVGHITTALLVLALDLPSLRVLQYDNWGGDFAHFLHHQRNRHFGKVEVAVLSISTHDQWELQSLLSCFPLLQALDIRK
ncbi:hypothetical protein C8R46DRAFT_1216807 [Mycena filopes]|nr:hypothetical protein C8R46DRAFT_1216807 [Mycena filopes]